jgi:hypothetical protein
MGVGVVNIVVAAGGGGDGATGNVVYRDKYKI